MIRRAGDVPKRGQKYKMRAGAYAILPIGRRFLLTADVSDVVDVQLPGGGIDPGESPLQALYREVREEIGWSIAQPLRLGAFRRFVFMPEYDMWAEKVCTIYVARPTLCQGPPSEAGHTAVWAPARVALELLDNVGDRAMLFGAMARFGL